MDEINIDLIIKKLNEIAKIDDGRMYHDRDQLTITHEQEENIFDTLRNLQDENYHEKLNKVVSYDLWFKLAYITGRLGWPLESRSFFELALRYDIENEEIWHRFTTIIKKIKNNLESDKIIKEKNWWVPILQ